MRAYEFHDVGRFHEKFGLLNTTYRGPGPSSMDRETIVFRMKFLCEELQEFMEGVGFKFHASLYDIAMMNSSWQETGPDHPQMFDALIDLVYVAYGTAHMAGYPWEEGWGEVQRANMQKIRATRADQSERGGTLDVIKPVGWEAPDIAGVLQRWGWHLEIPEAW
jgi:predicted HAD superfamily Cof-like phosphohydrolase